jgi:glycosyltransferase involved in cell wall biosynthesis
VVTAMLFEHNWQTLDVETLRMAYSDSLDSVGKASVAKIFHLFELVLQTWKLALTKRPTTLYYLPASANRTPVIRDIIYLLLVRWCFRRKVFHYHAGGLPEFLAEAGILGKLGRLAYRGADVSIEICETDLPPAQAFGARRRAIVPNGLDVNILPRQRAANAPCRILFVGGLNEGKGILEILKTARALRERESPEFEMLLVGAWASGEFEAEATAYIEEHQLGELVAFGGVLKGDDKWQAYADADVFFFPSHYASENFPLVLIEAMACGLPIVSTNWRGIPQLVDGSGCATLCEPRSTGEFADAIGALLSDQALREQMGKRSRNHYADHFTEAKFISTMEEIFTGVCQC